MVDSGWPSYFLSCQEAYGTQVDKMTRLTSLASLLALAAIGNAQSITKVTGFNMGPTAVGMYVYVPPNLKTPAPIVVAVHHCQGNAEEFSTETHFMPLASQRNFMLIYPNSKSSGGCFDVSSQASMSTPRPPSSSPPSLCIRGMDLVDHLLKSLQL